MPHICVNKLLVTDVSNDSISQHWSTVMWTHVAGNENIHVLLLHKMPLVNCNTQRTHSTIHVALAKLTADRLFYHSGHWHSTIMQIFNVHSRWWQVASLGHHTTSRQKQRRTETKTAKMMCERNLKNRESAKSVWHMGTGGKDMQNSRVFHVKWQSVWVMDGECGADEDNELASVKWCEVKETDIQEARRAEWVGKMRLDVLSQLQNITALWPVPNYTALWQRHMYVNNLPESLHDSDMTGSWSHNLLTMR